MSLSSISFTAPNSDDQADWLTAFNTAMNNLSKPAFAAADDQWRLPTEEEIKIFAKNTDYVMSFDAASGYGSIYFYLTNNTLKWGGYRKSGNELLFQTNTNVTSAMSLRPVIDMTY